MQSKSARHFARKPLVLACVGVIVLLLGIVVGRWLAGAL